MAFPKFTNAVLATITVLLSGTISSAADTVPRDAQAAGSGGYWFNCAIRANSRVGCWGSNLLGQLGDGNMFTNATQPVTPAGLGGNVIAVGTGGYHSCALKASGRVFCWGQNDKGQLGTGSAGGWSATPVEVPLPRRAQAIAVGHRYSCAVLRNRQVACWGENNEGQLGDGTRTDRAAPTMVEGLSNVTAIAANLRHTCALHRNQTVSCFGMNASGQVADTGNNRELTPVRVAGVRRILEIGLGQDHSCARQQSGHVQCWGNNLFGQLGRETVNSAPNAPGRVARLNAVVDLGMGRFHSCAATQEGRAFCWGANDRGQVGNGDVDNSPNSGVTMRSRVRRLANATIVAVHAGYDHSCALADDGVMRCWGANDFGQLGNATTDDSALPVRVRGGRFLVPESDE